MFPGNHHDVRLASPDDAESLQNLAALDSQAPLTGDVLVGHIGGVPVAALSLTTGRAIADPFRRTSHVVVQLRLRASGIAAYNRTPLLRDRIRAGLSKPAGAPAAQPMH